MSIGTEHRAPDWQARTSGESLYTPDVPQADLLFARIVRSTESRARIVTVDAAEALRAPQVVDVITSDDLRPLRYLHMGDGELTSSSDRFALARGEVRFIGEEVAAVAAETLDAATRAAELVRVRYKRRRPVLTVQQALDSRAPRVHEHVAGNVSATTSVRAGDLARARRRASASVSAMYSFGQQTQACMETNGITAWFDTEHQQLHLWVPTQSPYFVRKEIAHQLKMEPAQVRFHEVAIGGGFGSKSKISEHEICAAVLAFRTGRPVQLVLDRVEEFATTKPRHKFTMALESGATKDGRLTHRVGDVVVDNGAYNHFGPAVMGYGVGVLASMYRVEAQAVEGRLVYTNSQPGGQFRGYGGVQATFAVECQMDELADQLGIDPLELRLINANEGGDVTDVGWEIPAAHLRECIETLRIEMDWDAKRRSLGPGYGIGMSCALHVTGAMFIDGANRSGAGVDVRSDGTVAVRFGGADAGTGQRTVLAQIAAEELGVDVAAVSVTMMALHDAPVDLGAFSSRGTLMGGGAVRAAAAKAADRLRELAAEKLAVEPQRVALGDSHASAGSSQVFIGDLVRLADDAVGGVLRTEEFFTVDLASKDNVSPAYSFAALGVEVFVDKGTGKVTVLDVVSVHDSGTVINPAQFKSQVVGGVVMGLGAALGEELVHEQGRLVNPAFSDYALPRAGDVPRIRVVPIERPEPAGPYGAKGVGEISLVVAPAAVANAVAHATGARLRDLPITPDKVINAVAPFERSKLAMWRRPSAWWVSAIRWTYPRGLFAALRLVSRRIGRGGTVQPMSVIQPASLDEAAEVLTQPGIVPVGGGTDLLPARRQKLVNASHIVDLTLVDDLGHVAEQPDGGLSIGAAVTLSQLEQHAEVHGDRALRDAIASIASPQIRNAATVAGNLCQQKRCWFFRSGFDCYKRSGPASPCYAVLGDHRFYHAAMDGHRCQAVTPSDLATVLVAVDASVRIRSGTSSRTLPAGELYSGPGEVALKKSEFIVGVSVAAEMRRRVTRFEKLGLWTGDFAVVSAATALDLDDEGVVQDARVVVGAVAPTPYRLHQVEQILLGRRLRSGTVGALVERSGWEKQAHPLPRNAWKLQATSNLVEKCLESSLTER